MSIYSGPNPNLRNQPNGVPNLAVPEGSPSLYIDFVNNQYETVNNGIKTASSNAMSLITFTRSSNASYTAANGTIQYVANNIPRFDYDSTTGYCKGLLIEEQRTNLLTNSTIAIPNLYIFPNCTGTMVTNYTLAPDGTNTAQLLTVSGTGLGSQFYTYTAPTAPLGTTFTYSFYSTSPNQTGWFLCSVGVNQSNIIYTSVIPAANGWYRYFFVVTTNVINGSLGLGVQIAPGYSIVVWGGQIEQGLFATSYIPTTSTAVTRMIDNPTATLGSWYNGLQGTIYTSFDSLSPSSLFFPVVFLGYPATGTPHIINQSGGTFYAANFGYNGSVITNNAAGSFPNSSKVAYGYQPGNSALAVLGTVVTNSDANSFAINGSLSIGIYGGVSSLNGHMKQIAYFPTRISNTSLQQITT